MDEAQQIPNQNPITPIPPIATYPMTQSAPAIKTPWILISLIPILIGIASYFGYQNYQLKQRLTVQQSTSSPALIANSPMPSVSTVATTDPTANWKTYQDDIYKFSFKYPSDWKLNCTNTNLPDGWLDRNICDLRSPKVLLDHGQVSNGSYFVVGVSKPNPNYANFPEYLAYSSKQYGYTFTDKIINNINGKIGLTNKKETNYLFERNGHFINANWIYSETPEDINQILSTFKITD